MLDLFADDPGGTGSRPVSVREADHTDSDLVARFIEGLLRHRGLSVPADRSEIARRFRLNSGRNGAQGTAPIVEALIADLDGAPAGMLLFYTTFNAQTCRPGLFVEDLYIRGAMRGYGVGRALFERLAAIADSRHHSHVFFVVDTDKHDVRARYARMGAATVDKRTIMSFSGTELRALASKV